MTRALILFLFVAMVFSFESTLAQRRKYVIQPRITKHARVLNKQEVDQKLAEALRSDSNDITLSSDSAKLVVVKIGVDMEGVVKSAVVENKQPGIKYYDLVEKIAATLRFEPFEVDKKKAEGITTIQFLIPPVFSGMPDSTAILLNEKPINFDAVKREVSYPPMAREKNLQGTIFILLFVDESGNVISADPIKPTIPELAQEVINHIGKAKFSASKQKRLIKVPFSFKLQ